MEKYKSLLLISIIVLLISCTKEIDVNLNSSDAQIVIEGNIANGEHPLIRITKSIDFDEDNIFPAVENAIVSIKDDVGNSAVLVEIQLGYYTSSTFVGAIGRKFNITVETDSKILTAESNTPNQVPFDSLIVKESTSGMGFRAGSGTQYDVIVKFHDPDSEKNYYLFKEYVSGNNSVATYPFDDLLMNGSDIEYSLPNFSRQLNVGDTLNIEMLCIDKNISDYFNSFGNLYGGPSNSSTPANPNTNITGSQLGYFSAHTIEVKQFIVQ